MYKKCIASLENKGFYVSLNKLTSRIQDKVNSICSGKKIDSFKQQISEQFGITKILYIEEPSGKKLGNGKGAQMAYVDFASHIYNTYGEEKLIAAGITVTKGKQNTKSHLVAGTQDVWILPDYTVNDLMYRCARCIHYIDSSLLDKYSLIVEQMDEDEKINEVEMKTKDTIEKIKAYIEAKGFTYKDNLIENFYLSIKSKPFVILAGTSGTGKTKLVKLFAEAIGAGYKLVSVRPDWSDSSDLFGYVNLKNEFKPGAIIDYVKMAEKNPDKPYFLCLDEMNLVRVEYYLSDFLSIIETRHRTEKGIVTDEIILDKAAEKEYGKVIVPDNLYVIGTVNMDETTFPFSKKVLDRANTIEFSYVDIIPDFDVEYDSEDPIPQKNEFLITEYITLKADVDIKDKNLVEKVCGELQDINVILQGANAHVGYRVRDEIVFYMLNNSNAGLLKFEEAFDFEIMQKILPRIQGSSGAVKKMLCELFKKFAGDYTGLSQVFVSEQMQEYINSKTCKYRRSAEKICYMMRRFEEDGFTSYWL